MKTQKVLFTGTILLSFILLASCGEDTIKYSYSLDISKFADYKENEYCRTNINSLNDNNYPYLAQVKNLFPYLKDENGQYYKADTSIYPFDTNQIYIRYAKEKLDSTSTIYSLENILGKYTYETHCLFDRHYYYLNQESSLINNLKVINDSYASGKELEIDKRLYDILQEAKYLTKFSDGKFNLFVGELSDTWDYYISLNQFNHSDKSDSESYLLTDDPEKSLEGKEKISSLLSNTPQPSDIDNVLELKKSIDNEKEVYSVKFNKFKNAEKVSITLGGIGKGYLTEQLYSEYKKNNYTYGMLTAGTSSMVFFGNRVVNDNWYVGLSNPYGVYYDSLGTIKLDNTKYSASTSGSQVNYYYTKINDHIILRNHIIDPTTGYPNDYYNQIFLLSKSISSTKMDALSTILSNCSFDEIQSYITKIRNDSNFGDLEFIFFKKQPLLSEAKVDVYLSKGLQDRGIITKNNPSDCKISFHNLNY